MLPARVAVTVYALALPLLAGNLVAASTEEQKQQDAEEHPVPSSKKTSKHRLASEYGSPDEREP